ncbi:MAG: hypothetical protein R2733_21230 [Acidimicrobiales bacterium]
MAIEVTTKDCTALTDAEMGDMADLSAASLGWQAGLLSKQAEEWVLVSQAFDKGKLRGFVFSTLERIGGTPALIIGIGCVGRVRNRSSVLKALMAEQLHKTLMAFPDEDVIVAARLIDPGAAEAFSGLSDIRPWPDTRPNGEERAWGRRLAKRYQTIDFSDRTMQGASEDTLLVLDHEALKSHEIAAVFSDCRPEVGHHMITWGWAMAEFLERYHTPKH